MRIGPAATKIIYYPLARLAKEARPIGLREYANYLAKIPCTADFLKFVLLFIMSENLYDGRTPVVIRKNGDEILVKKNDLLDEIIRAEKGFKTTSQQRKPRGEQYRNAWVTLGDVIFILENSDQVAMSTAPRRRMAKYRPVDSNETCLGVDDNRNSLPDIGGGML